MKDILSRLDELYKVGGLEQIAAISKLKADVAEQVRLEEPIKSDFSQSNPKLHELYVGWAMDHLVVINRFIEELDGFSNLNLLDTLAGVHREREKLIMNDTAYRDAAARLMAGHVPPDEGDPRVGTTEDDGDLDDSYDITLNLYVFLDDEPGDL